MKKTFLSLAIVSITFTFAQKKEITAAYKAAETGDLTTVNSQISAADTALGGKVTSLEPELLEQYYYAKGLSLLKSGKITEGASFLTKINDLSKNKIYSGKDSSKNKVYFVGKAAADASGIQGLKEESYTITTAAKLAQSIDPLIRAASTEGNAAYTNKNYALAGEKFKLVYDLLKAAGQGNGQMLYNAAISYTIAGKKDIANPLFSELLASGYTGVETTYLATNADGKEVSMDKVTYDSFKKLGAASGYKDFKSEISKSVEQDIYETHAGNLVDLKNYDEAIALIDKGLKKFPNSAKLSALQGSAYYNGGKTSEFTQNLKAQLAKNPNDAVNWYNLGVMQSKDPAEKAAAETAFKKALELNPKMENAYQNIIFLIIGDDDAANKEYSALRKAGKIDDANKALAAKRARYVKALPYAEKWYSFAPNDVDVVGLLKGLYLTTQNTEKYNEFKAKETAMKPK